MERGPCAPFFFMKELEFVYLVSSVYDPLVVKLGMTNNWERRFKQLKIGHLAVEEVVIETEHARAVEKAHHELMAGRRLPQSEWFILHGDTHKNSVIASLKEAERAEARKRRKKDAQIEAKLQKIFGLPPTRQELFRIFSEANESTHRGPIRDPEESYRIQQAYKVLRNEFLEVD